MSSLLLFLVKVSSRGGEVSHLLQWTPGRALRPSFSDNGQVRVKVMDLPFLLRRVIIVMVVGGAGDGL